MQAKKINPPEAPEKGAFLISEPFMGDPNFKRSVVLLTELNDEGAVGFILNKPTLLSLNEVLRDFPEFPAPVFLGGPVNQETLHFIHRSPLLRKDTKEVSEGIWWGGDYEELKFLASEGAIHPEDFRFFLGYSGWGPDQLAEEMRLKNWILSRGNPDQTFSRNSEDLWKTVLRSLGKKFSMVANYPENPMWN